MAKIISPRSPASGTSRKPKGARRSGGASGSSLNLLIVESPGKLATLRKILGPGWILEASVGHTTELASDGAKRWGFDFEGERVVTRYVPRGDRGKQVLRQLREKTARAGKVYLATDPDREGEAIAWHLVEQLGLRNYCRVSYTQITEAAVRKAIAHPTTMDFSLIASQRARQCLDKLVGFEVSPLLWNSTGGKSAGRVQTATLHLVCERERERLVFKPEKYWVLKSLYQEGFEAMYEPERNERASEDPKPPAPASLSHGSAVLSGATPFPGYTSLSDENQRVRSAEEARLIREVAESSAHIVHSTDERVENKNPPPPFTTSSLQQSAGARFRYSPKQTMKIAQELYEGVRGKGWITYMRTDAISLSPEFVSEARAWLQTHAPEALPERPPFYRTKGDAQAAHEAIRPTDPSINPEKAALLLNAEQLNIYRLIWERAIASQCKPAKLSKTRIEIRAAQTRWVARGMTVLDRGYLRFLDNLEDEKKLPRVEQGQKLGLKEIQTEEKTTTAPPRYTEPKLVQLMEKKGIGRPSTYASTLATLKDREYVVLEKGFVVPTALGLSSDETLGQALPELVDTAFTAHMEESLDQIAEGKLPWERYLIDWNFKHFQPALTKARQVLGNRPAATPSAPSRSPRNSGTPASRRSTPKTLARSASQTDKLERAASRAARENSAPACKLGHGAMELRLSKKGTLYWKCPDPGCGEFGWHTDFSSEKCPVCNQPLEKIPSPKVTGGYFLKCSRKELHPDEVVLFRDKRTRRWQQKGVRASSS